VRSNRLPIIELRDVSVVRAGRPILDSVTLALCRGEHAAIIGANGSGKSTLIKVIAGQLYPSAPHVTEPPVRILGRDRWNLEELRSHLGVVSGDLHQRYVAGSSIGRATGLDAVIASFFGSEMIFLHHRVEPSFRRRAAEALDRVGASALGAKKMNQMSSGEVGRVLIARALVHEPELLILDEPTSGLDLVARHEFLEQLRKLAVDGTTILLVTHLVEEILPEIGRVVVMRQGRLLADGTPHTVLTSDVLSNAYGANVELRRVDGRFALSIGARSQTTTRAGS